MVDATDYRTMRIPLRHGSGAIPAGFGALIADQGGDADRYSGGA
jgi:hypothetical protein